MEYMIRIDKKPIDTKLLKLEKEAAFGLSGVVAGAASAVTAAVPSAGGNHGEIELTEEMIISFSFSTSSNVDTQLWSRFTEQMRANNSGYKYVGKDRYVKVANYKDQAAIATLSSEQLKDYNKQVDLDTEEALGEHLKSTKESLKLTIDGYLTRHGKEYHNAAKLFQWAHERSAAEDQVKKNKKIADMAQEKFDTLKKREKKMFRCVTIYVMNNTGNKFLKFMGWHGRFDDVEEMINNGSYSTFRIISIPYAFVTDYSEDYKAESGDGTFHIEIQQHPGARKFLIIKAPKVEHSGWGTASKVGKGISQGLDVAAKVLETGAAAASIAGIGNDDARMAAEIMGATAGISSSLGSTVGTFSKKGTSATDRLNSISGTMNSLNTNIEASNRSVRKENYDDAEKWEKINTKTMATKDEYDYGLNDTEKKSIRDTLRKKYESSTK